MNTYTYIAYIYIEITYNCIEKDSETIVLFSLFTDLSRFFLIFSHFLFKNSHFHLHTHTLTDTCILTGIFAVHLLSLFINFVINSAASVSANGVVAAATSVATAHKRTPKHMLARVCVCVCRRPGVAVAKYTTS